MKHKRKLYMLAIVALSALAVMVPMAGAWVGDATVNPGVWFSTPGYAQRTSSGVSTNSGQGVTSNGYLQIKYETPAGAIVYNSGAQWGPREAFSTTAGCSYCMVFFRFGEPGSGAKTLHGEANG